MLLRLSFLIISLNFLVLLGCESEACLNYQNLCNHDVDSTMCEELLENQPSSLYECINEASTCGEIHQCILNTEDESVSMSSMP